MWPGGPLHHVNEEWPADSSLFAARTEEEYRLRLARFFQYRDDVTLPEHGWPWPWNDSRTTDYAYALDGGKVWASGFGRAWFDPMEPEADDAVFPDMTDRKNVTFGRRSGLTVIGAKGIVEED